MWQTRTPGAAGFGECSLMTKSSNHESLGRNAPCPCGSGKKYKRCCMATEADQGDSGRKPRVTKLQVVLILLLISMAAVWGSVSFIGSSAESTTGSTPEAWEYDEANNRHWDPGHGHWHNGPPPPQHRDPDQEVAQPPAPRLGLPGSGPSSTGTRGSAENDSTEAPATPKPWEYDAANNRHWDPNHGHWHRGPPPNR